MSTATKLRPSRQIREARLLEQDRAHLEHYRLHLDLRRSRHGNPLPTWDGALNPVTFAGPWKNRERAKVLEAWGVPPKFDDFTNLVHLPGGGWGVFELPPMPDVYAFMVKAAKHLEAVMYLDLIAHVAVYSRLTLSEAFALAMDCVRLDPRTAAAPQLRANDWARFGVTVVNVWEARTQNDGEHLGDHARIAHLLHELLGLLGEWGIRQAELDLEARRTRHGTRSPVRLEVAS